MHIFALARVGQVLIQYETTRGNLSHLDAEVLSSPEVTGGILSLLFYEMNNERLLSVFVDESGNFGDPKDPARFCIVTLVLHDQSFGISRFIRELDRANYDLGLDPETFQFHTAPLIRQDDEYSAMSRRMRGRILDRMLTFVRNVDFRYCCFSVDTDFVNTSDQIFEKMKRQMVAFIGQHRGDFESTGSVKVYYDAGQKPVSRLLAETLGTALSCPVVFAQGARQEDYKLLQVADLICTVHLIELRLAHGLPLNLAESRFFGGARDFKRNVLKKIKAKAL